MNPRWSSYPRERISLRESRQPASRVPRIADPEPGVRAVELAVEDISSRRVIPTTMATTDWKVIN